MWYNEIAEKIWFAFIEKPTNYNDWESNELVVVECLYIVQESWYWFCDTHLGDQVFIVTSADLLGFFFGSSTKKEY